MADRRRDIVAEGRHGTDVRPSGLRRAKSRHDEVATEHLVLNFGPQHPSMHGVLHMLVELDGEQIVSAEMDIGFLHRGLEKLAEHRRYHQVPTLLDRADYVSGIHTEMAFAMAVEQLMDIEVPRKALWLRTLLGEMNRMASHLMWVGAFGNDAGGMAQFLYALRDRDHMLNILEAITGARMMFNYVRPGGVLRDLPPEAEPLLRRFISEFRVYLREYHELLTGNEIFQRRTRGVGVIDRQTALSYGVTGASLRASGFGWDVRTERPYAAYPELEFDVPIGIRGDCWDRFLCRMDELRVSAGIIEQVLDGLPEGDVTAKVPKVLRPPAGEVYACVESPRGELGIHVVSDGSDLPYRVKIRPPAYYNLQVLEHVLPGVLIADAIVIGGSLDFVLGEIDR